jgi:DNA-binding NtrC family response regulator
LWLAGCGLKHRILIADDDQEILSTLREIKAIDPHIEILIMTGYAHIESLNVILENGGSDYILKPFHKTDITHTVRNST